MESLSDPDELRAEIDRLRDLCAAAESAVGAAEAELQSTTEQLHVARSERDHAVHERNVMAAGPGGAAPGSSASSSASSSAGLIGRARAALRRR